MIDKRKRQTFWYPENPLLLLSVKMAEKKTSIWGLQTLEPKVPVLLSQEEIEARSKLGKNNEASWMEQLVAEPAWKQTIKERKEKKMEEVPVEEFDPSIPEWKRKIIQEKRKNPNPPSSPEKKPMIHLYS
jgi:hypothetical protein